MIHVRLISFFIVAIFATACAILGPTPEAQIKTGANTVSASANLTATLLERKRISKAQATTYLDLLRTAGRALDDAERSLIACRKVNPVKATPDPCQGGIAADVALALSVMTQVESVLKGAQ